MFFHDPDFKPPASEQERLLREQAITMDEPGPIVRDFETLLGFVGEDGLCVSASQHLIYSKRLPELNTLLSHPLDADYKRPTQQGYPYIHGLYLLLRSTGLAESARWISRHRSQNSQISRLSPKHGTGGFMQSGVSVANRPVHRAA